ncbi:MAG: MgtC/SapB family protein [Chloroflexi bacterium]|nr:MgtC/SapB family protein [Chloroflexota bacterium]
MDPILVEKLIKLGMAVLIGGIIGVEREFQDKAAGFRTIILITVGSTLFTIFSLNMDPGFTQTRIAANIVTGIGFLGAGAIIREGGRIAGMTTAATIWLSAALGMGIGAGELVFVSIATLVVIVVLLVFPHFEERIDRIREARIYKIAVGIDKAEKVAEVQKAFEENSMHILDHHETKSGDTITGTWRVIGPVRGHDTVIRKMLEDRDIKEMTY